MVTEDNMIIDEKTSRRTRKNVLRVLFSEYVTESTRRPVESVGYEPTLQTKNIDSSKTASSFISQVISIYDQQIAENMVREACSIGRDIGEFVLNTYIEKGILTDNRIENYMPQNT